MYLRFSVIFEMFFLNLVIEFCPSFQKAKLNEKINHSEVEEIVIRKGTERSWLICPPEGGSETVWKKDGSILSYNRSQFGPYHPILCATEKDEGNYFCYNRSKTETPMKKFIVKVIEAKNFSPCGKPNKDLIQEGPSCKSYTKKDFPCCVRMAPPPRSVEVFKTFKQSCNLSKAPEDTKLSDKWNIGVRWKKPSYGSENIWGWQIRIHGLDGHVNHQYCFQINSRDYTSTWTIPNRVELRSGATYSITVQSLPFGLEGPEANFRSKTITTPNFTEICRKIGHKCGWGFCWPVKNVTVRNQNTSKPVVLWYPSEYHRLKHSYEVHYWAEKDCDGFRKIMTNDTRLIMSMNVGHCTKYFVKVRPIFNNSVNGIFTKEVLFYVKHPEPPDYCYSVRNSPCCLKDIAVEQHDQQSVRISWTGLGNKSDLGLFTAFDFRYKSDPNGSCYADKTVRRNILDFQNNSYVVKKLNPSCQNYTIQIRPVFKSSRCDECPNCDPSYKEGVFTEDIKFQLKTPYPPVGTDTDTDTESHVPEKSQHWSNLSKAVIVVASALIFILFPIVFKLMFKHCRQARREDKRTGELPKENPVTEVFIAHGSHCRACEDVVISLAAYLNMTGYCKCFMDLCSLPNEWSVGKTQYYEKEIKKRQKVIIICTVNEQDENQENPAARTFIYQKNLVRSEILDNYTTTKFIPVYMDFSSDHDIPCFLRNMKFFSLPSQLMELVLYIIGQPLCSPVSMCPMSSLQEDAKLLKEKKIIESKIRYLKTKHQKNPKNKNNNLPTKV